MKVILFGEGKDFTDLEVKVKNSLDELWLVDFIELETTSDETLQETLGIKETPALIIEEETIDFRDTIFEGIVPDEEEIKSMFVSIIGWWWGGSCSDEWGCGTCGSWCG